VLADLIVVAAGWGVIGLVARGRPRFGLVGGLALSFLAGATALALATTLLTVAGLPLWLVVPAMLALAAAGVVRPRQERSGVRTAGAAGVLALLVGARLVVPAASSPVVSNDEYALWALRGRALWLGDGLDPGVFANAAGQYQHLDYPLLVPSLVAWSDRFAGGVHDGAAAQTALLLAALFAVVAWGVTRLAGRAAGVVAVLLCAVPTGIAAFSQRVYADLPAASFSMATLLLVLAWLESDDDRLVRIAGVMCAGALLTKNEGALFAIVAMLVGLALARRRRRLAAASLAGAVVAYLPWPIWTRANGIENDVVNSSNLAPDRVVDNLSRLGTIADGFVQYWPTPLWTLALLAAALAVAARAGRGGLAVATAAVFALSVAGMAAIFVLTPLDLEGHLESAAHRVLIFPSLVALIAVPLLAGAVLRDSGSVRPAAARRWAPR
jgi:hypothetical protein